jgi:hypothetical protein
MSFRQSIGFESHPSGSGRSHVYRELRVLIGQMGAENPFWGAPRIVGGISSALPQRPHRSGEEHRDRGPHHKPRFPPGNSVGGPLTGRGGQLIIIDDPMKPDEVPSELARTRVIDWYEKTLTSRIDNKSEGAIILVMQRLHIDDLAGHLLTSGRWDYLELSAVAEIEERIPLGRGRIKVRRPGELLFPAREPLAVLERQKREMGTYAFSAELSDYSVGTVWGRFGDEYALLDLVRGKYGYPELKRMVIKTAAWWPTQKS